MVAAAICIAVGGAAMDIGASFAVAMAVGDIVGASVVGAAVGAGLSTVAQLVTTGKVDWDKVGTGTWEGAATGAVAGGIQAAMDPSVTGAAGGSQGGAQAAQAAKASDYANKTLQTTNDAGQSTYALAQQAAQKGLTGADFTNYLTQNGVDPNVAASLAKADPGALASTDQLESIGAAKAALSNSYQPTMLDKWGAAATAGAQKVLPQVGVNALKGALTPTTPTQQNPQQTTLNQYKLNNANLNNPNLILPQQAPVMNYNSLMKPKPITLGGM